MPFGAAKKCIGKMPARRQCAKVKKFGGVPYPLEVTNVTPSLPLDRRGQGYQSTEFENCCVAPMWYTGAGRSKALLCPLLVGFFSAHRFIAHCFLRH
jgi:hypothetical protein